MAWPALTVALARSAATTVPAVLDGSAGVDEAFTALAALIGLALLAWLALMVVAVTVVALQPGDGRMSALADRLGAVVTPAGLRRLLTLAIAGAIVSGASPAHAAELPQRRPAVTSTAVVSSWRPLAHASAGAGDLDPGWAASSTVRSAAPAAPTRSASPTKPPATSPASATSARTASAGAATPAAFDPAWGGPERARPGSYPEEAVVVRRGDTLWDIAARDLGRAATDAEIARSWPLWFTANRATIGPDPDRLTPGQRLYPPVTRAGGQP
jgi:hypothetical protein